MLAVEGGDDLAAAKVGKRNDLHFRETEHLFDLDARAVLQQGLQAPGAEADETFGQLVDKMEAFPVRQFVQQFQQRPFGGRDSERPVPLAPWQDGDAAVMRVAAFPAGFVGPVQAGQAACQRIGLS